MDYYVGYIMLCRDMRCNYQHDKLKINHFASLTSQNKNQVYLQGIPCNFVGVATMFHRNPGDGGNVDGGIIKNTPGMCFSGIIIWNFHVKEDTWNLI